MLRLGVDLAAAVLLLLQLHLELPGLDPQLGRAVSPVRGGRAVRAWADGAAGRGCPEEGGVVSPHPTQLLVGPVGGERGQDWVEGGHGGRVGEGGGLGGGQG